MAELLLELFSEEIPARMQNNASDAIKSLLEGLFKASDMHFEGVDTYSTPRRLTAHVTGLPAKTPDISEERRGPKVGAPEQAVEGFCRGAGVDAKDLVQRGGYYYAKIEKKGAASAEVLAAALPALIEKFPWPKSMRWGAGSMRWVRPLHSVLCILDGKVVPFEVDGVKSGNTTEGHRFLAEGPFAVKNFEDYKHRLNHHYVMLDTAERKNVIVAAAEKLVQKQGVDLVMDEGLLDEVAGLVEWPVVLMGSFDKAFLDIPGEALMSEMRQHQKYFPCRDARSGKLANKFLFVSNVKAEDGGKAIVAGNERVLSARLHDAKFFWDQDRKVRLEERLPALKEITFQNELGTLANKVERLETLALEIDRLFNKDKTEAEKYASSEMVRIASRLCKADLVTNLVKEFPDLQGTVGYYLAEQNHHVNVARAIRDHYLPLGPKDHCPTSSITVPVGLADRIDSLVGFFSIGVKPTGSKDPFALRRAALGVLRLITENLYENFASSNYQGLWRFNLLEVFRKAFSFYKKQNLGGKLFNESELLEFIIDRLKVQQKEQGVRHDLIDAVFSIGGEDDLVRLLARVSALQEFLKTKDGENLLAGYKRAVNIVKIEEKKDGKVYSGKTDPHLMKEKEEIALHQGLEAARERIVKALKAETFSDAMAAVAVLRKPIDDFFDHVTVNTGETRIRANRLRLLSGIREALLPIADFSKIEG